MRAAHQGVPVAGLPMASQGGLFANAAPSFTQPNSPQPDMPAATTGMAGRPAPTRTSVRPEAASGLDGWLMDRLFGGR
jgi:penicillin-binding protein 1A